MNALEKECWAGLIIAAPIGLTLFSKIRLMGVPGAIAPPVGSIHARPNRFVDSLKISDALRATIADEALRQLPECAAADPFLSSNSVLTVPDCSKITTLVLLDTKLGGERGVLSRRKSQRSLLQSAKVRNFPSYFLIWRSFQR
ncbi:hypothetical protein [Microvirga sp. VF16]|uniref:hypothetical protein n=1 Tax=Microvirga sp. VF16 TaxID=2807101 RepID=UPI00193DCA45|nr:hypothetical protein [Microvirga sp. VF16]QRM32701.1 hypothetical protein JO965_32040 [Microvirga sp. VF16]